MKSSSAKRIIVVAALACLGLEGCEAPDLSSPILPLAKGDEPDMFVPLLPKVPHETDAGIHMVSDEAFFDLRYWKPPVVSSPGHSAGILTDVMHMTRCAHQKLVTFHFATSGSSIALKCLTHPYSVTATQSEAPHENQKTYALTFDVSKEKPHTDFKVVVRAVYWDGFKSGIESADTYTLGEVESKDLSLSVAFPAWNKPKWIGSSYDPNGGESYVPYPIPKEPQTAKDNSWVRWKISKKLPGSHYRLSWEWDPKAEPKSAPDQSAALPETLKGEKEASHP